MEDPLLVLLASSQSNHDVQYSKNTEYMFEEAPRNNFMKIVT
jgi:hypothetical protein